MEHSYFNKVKSQANKSGETGIAARQLMTIYNAARQYSEGVFLELGTDRGQATRMLLKACEETNSKLVSVDIRDCSDILVDQNWHFIKSDSIDRDYIFEAAPILSKGIDLLYVDSLHTASHVKREVDIYFEYLNQNSIIFFDDIDSNPYMRGHRKDNPMTELSNRQIFKLIKSIFYNNINQLDLKIALGSTGLVEITKHSELGSKLLSSIEYPSERNIKVINLLRTRFGNYYSQKGDNSDMLIGIE